MLDLDIKRELLFAETAEEVDILVKAGADVNGLMGSVFPLALAENLEVAKALIANGADVNFTNKKGETAIFYNKNIAVIKFLISQGANINHLNNDGETALFKTSDIEMIKALIKLGCSPFLKNKNGDRHDTKIKPADKEEYQSFMNKLKEMIRNALEQKKQILQVA
ncbi:ankyrin repeat domain-containing protein [Salmonella enterica]|nr:ankyrin repeat domain-containing protein [Salmonella enterica]EGJ8061804.1 ankyrin repeat domain-containing protein [Salmonella enterica]EKH0926890.1 ankyrin repeat domain-containing protein [Salmonella enterica]